MDKAEYIELAKAYVALSSAHRLEFVLPMFADEATYHSPHVGEFKGRDAIGVMMSEFFSRYPDVRWDVQEYRCIDNGVVEFNFTMFATEAETGKTIERTGRERIEFTDVGQISRLEVGAN